MTAALSHRARRGICNSCPDAHMRPDLAQHMTSSSPVVVKPLWPSRHCVGKKKKKEELVKVDFIKSFRHNEFSLHLSSSC